MPSPIIAPWLHQPNFIEAMVAGGQAGIHSRAVDNEAIQAGDRLRLAYDQLNANEQREQEAEANKMELAKASMALRSQQMDALEQYRQDQVQARQANMERLGSQFGEREKRMSEQFGEHENRLSGQFGTRMDLMDQRLQDQRDREARLADQFQAGLALRKANAATYPGKLDPASQALLGVDATELRRTQAAIDKIDAQGGPSRSLLGLREGNTAVYAGLKAKEAALKSRMAGYQTMKQGAGVGDIDPETGNSLPADGATPRGASFKFNPTSGMIEPIGQPDSSQ